VFKQIIKEAKRRGYFEGADPPIDKQGTNYYDSYVKPYQSIDISE